MRRVLRVGVLLFTLLTFTGVTQGILAQPTFTVENQSVEEGELVEVPVFVSNFEQIIGLQFSMNWETEVLEYQGLSQLALDLTPESFGVFAEDGALSVAYIDMTLQGQDLNDGDVLFAIMFRPIGEVGTTTTLGFSNNPTVQEVTDTTQQAIAAEFVDGTLEVVPANVSAVLDASTPVRINEITPNPFSNATTVSWTQRDAGNITWEIYSTSGQLIKRDQVYFSAGEQTLSLTKENFPAAGSYILRLQYQNHVITKKLIFFEP